MGVLNFSIEDLQKKGDKKREKQQAVSPSLTSVEEILAEAKLRHFTMIPLDIYRVVTEIFGVEVQLENMDRNISGYLEENPKAGKWVIFLNQYDNPRRRNFTMAHELAHLVLQHNNQLINGRKDEVILLRSDNDDLIEKAADDFAANLLMPKESFAEAIEKGINTFEKLALQFGVSISAVKYRAYKLGYIGKY